MKYFGTIIIMLACISGSGVVFSSEKFGMYDDSKWGVGISHKTSGFAMGSCSEGFFLDISKGGGTIDLDITMKFIGKDPINSYIGSIETTLTGSTGGRSIKEYVESPDLCFEIKEVIIIKAVGIVNGKARDLIKEKKMFESGIIPMPIKIGENG